MNRSESADLSGPFWQDIPDTVLEEIYKQLESGEDLTSFGDGSGDEGDMDEDNLPSLFPTPSLVDVATIKPEQREQQEQANANAAHAHTIVAQIAQLEDHQRQQIEKMQQIQQQLCQSLLARKELTEQHSAEIQRLQEQQYQLNQQIELELKELRTCNRTALLAPPELHNSRLLGQRLLIQQQLLDLYRKELAQLTNGGNEALALLVIQNQPIPQVTFKNKSLDDNYIVKLITASNVEFQNVSKVKCQLVSEERTWKTEKPLENDEASMDIIQRIATFHHLKVQVSTRMSMVFMKFGMQILQSTGQSPVIQSHPSYPLIVITNESQWCEAAGKLVLMDSFAGQLEVPWAQFANGLHHHFLKATRQEPARPARCIKPHEFDFIHKKFFNFQAVVSTQQANRFWNWFGQVTQTLRFKRHISTLWFTGLIYGFITKNETNAALASQPEGTFLIRFSESYPGLFAVGYVSDDPTERIKHYLVKPDDTGSQKTLPDFLREKPQFQFLYQLDPNTGHMSRYAKDTVLSSLYSKGKRLNSQQNGYVLL